MNASITGQSAQAKLQYTRAAQEARGEALRVRAGDGAAKARVRTRTFGLQLGSFGLTYTSEDVQLEPTSGSGTSAASSSGSTLTSSSLTSSSLTSSSLSGSAFDQAIETASLRREMVNSSATETLSRIPPQRRNGLRAYQNALMSGSGAASRSLLGVA